MLTTICSITLIASLLFLMMTILIPKSSMSDSFAQKWNTSGIWLSLFISVGFWMVILLNGNQELSIFTYQGLGLEFKLDSLSVTVYTMIAIIGLVVLRYSKNYLKGEKRYTNFFATISMTIAFVQMLVLSGNLATLFVAWVGTSIGLHQLILFYKDRPKAQLAAKKKFIVARLGDASLIVAFSLIYAYFGTGNIESILSTTQASSLSEFSIGLELAMVFLVISAALKSVQLPFHGWLIEVMETPTPVSALLHAGLLNAGPFLMIRFSYLFDGSSAMIVLLIIGGMSAIFGALSASAQPVIKTSLAYSSVAHMGFTLFLCGLGVYSAALLHLIAHSFYKAYAFLSAGELVNQTKQKRVSNFRRKGNWTLTIVGLLSAVLLVDVFAFFWGVNLNTEPQLLIISGIIFLGIIALQLNTWDSENLGRSIFNLVLTSALVINSFFLFESALSNLLVGDIAPIAEPTLPLLVVAIATFVMFTAIVLLFNWKSASGRGNRFSEWRIHFQNGLYINQFFNSRLSS